MDTWLVVLIVADESIVRVIAYILRLGALLITGEAKVRHFQWVSSVLCFKEKTLKFVRTVKRRHWLLFWKLDGKLVDKFLSPKSKGLFQEKFPQIWWGEKKKKKKKNYSYFHLHSYRSHLFSLSHTHPLTATFLHLQLYIFITSHRVSHTAITLFSDSHLLWPSMCVCVCASVSAPNVLLQVYSLLNYPAVWTAPLINNSVITLMCHSGSITPPPPFLAEA